MAATLTASVSAAINFTYSTALAGSITPTTSSGFSYSYSLTSGTGALGTADLLYAAAGTLAASANTGIDLVGGSTDYYGTTITMARLKYWLIKNTADTTATAITVGNHANAVLFFSANTATISVRNNGLFMGGCPDATGIAMTAATSDVVKLLNADGTNTATYNVVFIGSSA